MVKNNPKAKVNFSDGVRDPRKTRRQVGRPKRYQEDSESDSSEENVSQGQHLNETGTSTDPPPSNSAEFNTNVDSQRLDGIMDKIDGFGSGQGPRSGPGQGSSSGSSQHPSTESGQGSSTGSGQDSVMGSGQGPPVVSGQESSIVSSERIFSGSGQRPSTALDEFSVTGRDQFLRQKAELEAARALARIAAEEEHQKFQQQQLVIQMEQNRLKRERAIIEKELELQRMGYREENENDVLLIGSQQRSVSNDNNQCTQNSKNQFHETGVQQQQSCIGSLAESLAQALQMCAGSFQPQGHSELGKFVARQSVRRGLPTFDGDHPDDWPIFISEFRESTKECSFSDVENMNRLRDCLKGKAREAVKSLLLVTTNVEKVIQKLEDNFGRADQIVVNLISEARSMEYLEEDDIEGLLQFSNVVENLVTTVESLNKGAYMMSPELMSELVSKLPLCARVPWGQAASRMTHDLTIRDLSDWLGPFAKAMIQVRPLIPSKRKSGQLHHYEPNQKKRKVQSSYHGATVLATTSHSKFQNSKICLFCQNAHELKNCREFLKESLDSRWSFVKKQKACFSCLDPAHPIKDCPYQKSCGVSGCRRNHHPNLHRPPPPPQQQQRRETGFTETVGHTSKSSIPKKRVLLKIIPVTLKGPKGQVETWAMLDDGSTVTLLDSSIAQQIGAEGPAETLTLRWTSDVGRQVHQSNMVKISIGGENGEFFEMNDVRTVDGLDLPTQSVNIKMFSNTWKHLKRVNLDKMANVKPTILIGQDNWELLLTSDVIRGPKDSPVVSKTKLGWVLHGSYPQHAQCSFDEFVFNINHEESDEALHKLVKDSFSTEDFGVKVLKELPRSKEDIRARAIMDKTTRRVGDRWETGLLWKQDDPVLPESKSTALRRLRSLEKRLDRDSEFAVTYCAQMVDNFEKGYARVLSPEEAALEGPLTWYLSHFGVTNPNKPGKVRVVFDAAAKCHGVSLNDVLLKGPDLLVPLPTILWKFRQYSIGFGGDIREMFPQSKIRLQDQSALRFFWRGMERTQEPQVCAMDSMVFGVDSSPFQSQEIKNRNALEFVDEFPEAVKAILEKHYMDDYWDSRHSAEKAIKLIHEVIEVHGRGGFEMVKWVSNSKKVMEAIPAHLRVNPTQDLNLESESQSERVLGVQWNPFLDVFKFCLKFHRVPDEILRGRKIPTKREVLRVVMSIFDPLGFLAHLVVKAKILYQDIWRSGVGWDDEVTQVVFTKWINWISNLESARKMTIPRCYSSRMEEAESIQLHVFCDSSEQAFAAVAYIRIVLRGGGVDTAIVTAKTRVTPLRPMSIPKLELQAALMGSRLSKSIIEGHELEIGSTFFWSDNKTVLLWLRSEARKYKPFVAHRVGEIEELTDGSSWRWIPTLENVADDATRDTKEADVSPGSRWLNGPSFLKLPESEWPVERVRTGENEVEEEELELRPQFVGVIVPGENPALPNIHKFSKWSRLVRATAWVLRFIDRCRGVKRSSSLTPEECDRAEMMWCRQCQLECFHLEVDHLKRKKPLNEYSRLLSLSPFLDNEKILRVNGRTENSKNLDHWTMKPIILDPKHPYTGLLIHHHHVRVGHHGQETVVNELKQKFWILSMRTAVRSCWNSCQHCKNQRAKPGQPQMAPLPDCRVNQPLSPFTNVGMDYFGPLRVTVGKMRKEGKVVRVEEKRYGVLFTCLSTRAVHLELAASLTTNSAIMAIRRMISRRGRQGCQRSIFSDNGTNLTGADRELRSALKVFDHFKIVDELTPRAIKWHFNPPAAPHMGGSWERLVRSVKTALRSTLRSRAPSEEVLRTLLVEAEDVVNNRPLTHVSVDPSDPESLTPNHFLKGPPNGRIDIPGVFVEKDLSLKKQWRLAQILTDHFWKRWVREYLPTLTRRTKWYKNTEPIKEGDLVIIVDHRLPRNHWPKGVVNDLYPGRDGVTRVVDVKTSHGVYMKRAVSSLCVLDVHK